MTIVTECPFCGCVNFINVSDNEYREWQNGELVQKAFPKLSAGEREMLISGICPDCWDNMFREEE